MVDEQKFFAWLDGELPEPDAAQVEAEVAADAALARRAAQHRALSDRLRAAFDPVLSTPVSLNSYAPQAGSNVASLAKARAERSARRVPAFWQQAAAVAAVFVMGIATGNMLRSGPASPIASEAGELVAQGPLEEALYMRLASQPVEDGPRIGLTFRDRAGKLCRTFADGTAAGLACQEQGDWRVRAVFQAPEGQGTDYRMASGMNPQLAALVDETIAGEPFDAQQERAARERDWR